MENKNLIPEVRFPEFTEGWNESKFENHFEFKNTNSFSRDNLNYEDGEILNIHYGDIHTKFKTHFDIEKEEVPFINQDVNISRINDENYVQNGDLVIADASEDYADIGKTIEVTNTGNKKILAGLHTFLARKTDSTLADGFFGHLLTNYNVRLELMRIAQGTKVLGLSKGRVNKVPLFIPEPDEQQKIATFLTAIDKRISLLKEKKDNLIDYKKGVMQRIFKQEIRFKDDEGNDFPDWEEKLLGEVCFKKSSNISANSLKNNSGEFKIYGAIGHIQNIDYYTEEVAYIGVIKDGAGVGRTILCEPKTSVLGTLDIISANDGNNLYFIYSLLNRINFEKYISGSTIPHIYFKDYSKEKVKVPTIQEQTKIAQFLTDLDTKIDGLQSKVDELIEYKKGLLQKMFV